MLPQFDPRAETNIPNLKRSGYKLTSPSLPWYNCIAWAAADEGRWWWPISGNAPGPLYWPQGAPKQLTLDSFVKAFETLGYSLCADGSLEPGFEKVAIYAQNTGQPTHAARQLKSGEWTSKLGMGYDIVHPTLAAVEGGIYGTAQRFLRRAWEQPT
jgi:hypothetical protein